MKNLMALFFSGFLLIGWARCCPAPYNVSTSPDHPAHPEALQSPYVPPPETIPGKVFVPKSQTEVSADAEKSHDKHDKAPEEQNTEMKDKSQHHQNHGD